MTIRPPLISPTRQKPGPAPFANQNLLEGALANAGKKPFLQTEWPAPRAAVYPQVTRTWARAAQTQLIGKDTFFGGAGKAPTYEYPNPRVAPYPISNRTWAATYNWGNLGKDTFFGPPGEAPTYDWPLPRAAALPGKTWVWSQQLLPTLASPFAQFDWPTRVAMAQGQTWIWSQTITVTPNAPFYQTAWPLPQQTATQVRSWTTGAPVQLAGKDTFFGAPGQGPANMDWPLPKVAPFPAQNRTWSWQALLPPLDSAFPFNQTVTALSRGAPLAIADVMQSMLALRAVDSPIPFNQLDWPLPGMAMQIRSSIEERNPNLLPPDVIVKRILRTMMGVGQ